MRARWESVRAALVSTISTLEAEWDFRRQCDEEPVLRRFTSPTALVAYLNDPSGDRDEKNRIYGVFVAAVQLKADTSELATSVIWLGLWPGLDAIYRRRLKSFIRQPDALASELGIQFTDAIARADLSKINRVAATLIRNTERELVRALVDKRTKEVLDLPDDEALAKRKNAGPFGIPADALEKLNVISLNEQIDRVAYEDRELLRAVLLLGENQREAAERLGIPYEVARKRTQRAFERLRMEIDTEAVPVSPRNRRFLSEGERR